MNGGREMDVREKLIELLTEFYGCDPMYYGVDALAIAQHLTNFTASILSAILSHMSFSVLCVSGALPHIALPGGGVGPIYPGLFLQPLGLIRPERLAALPADPAWEPVRAIFYAGAFHSAHLTIFSRTPHRKASS